MNKMDAKFPDVTVELVGQDGNAMSIIGRVLKALRRGGATEDEQNIFLDEAMSGDYNNVIQTTMRWVNVE